MIVRFFLLGLTSLVLLSCSTFRLGSSGIEVPDFDEETLDNGLKVVFAEDPSLPLVNFRMMVSPGASNDPIGKSGLGFLVVKLMDKGAAGMTADQISDEFANLGTAFSGQISHDYMIFSTESLAGTAGKTLDLFHKVVTRSTFSKKELNILKKRTLAAIKKSHDDPGDFIDQVFAQQMMGAHPYGRPLRGRPRDLKGLDLNEVKAHYKTYLRPTSSTLIVTGDISKELKKEVTKLFSKWKVDLPKLQESRPSLTLKADSRELLIVNRDDLQQTQLRFGHQGIRRSDEDYWALQVANVVLGGGSFSSRLMKEIRVKRGLTYGVRSGFQAGVYAGPFEVSTFTRHEKVGETVTVALQLLEEFRNKGVTDKELRTAKNYLKGSLIRGYENPSDVVSAIVRLRLYGLDADEVTDVVDKVDSVSLKQVNRVIADRFKPQQMRILIYAPRKKVIDQLRQVGALKVRDYQEFL